MSTWTSETKQVGALASGTKQSETNHTDTQNFPRSPSENLLNNHLKPRSAKQQESGQMEGQGRGSKEVYTFGKKPVEHEEPKIYMLPSPKIKHKKIRAQHKRGGLDKGEKTRATPNERESTKITSKQPKEQKLKNVFNDTFQSNKISRGKDSQKDISDRVSGSSPKNFHLMSFGQTFGDQPKLRSSKGPRDKSPLDPKFHVNTKKHPNFMTNRVINSQENISGKLSLKEGFHSHRLIGRPAKMPLQNVGWGSKPGFIEREPKLDMKKMSKGNPKQSDSRNRSQSNSSGSGANMAPAWNDVNQKKDSLEKEFMKKANYAYQFKNPISPKKEFLRSSMKTENAQTLLKVKKKAQVSPKNGLRRRGQRKTANKRFKVQNLSLKKPNHLRRNPQVQVSTGKKLNGHLRQLQSANKIFKIGRKGPLKGATKPGKMSFNIFKKGSRGSHLGEQTKGLIKSQQHFMPGKLKVGRKDRLVQKSRKGPHNIPKVKSIKTERLMKRKKSKEPQSQRFNSNLDNTNIRKSGNKFMMTRKTPGTRQLKRIPYKSPRHPPSSMKHVKLQQKKLFLKPCSTKQFSSSINSKRAKGSKQVKMSPVPPSIGSMNSVKNVNTSPMNKRTGYFMQGLGVRNRSQRNGTPRVGKLGGLRGKKTQKKISARREYFDTQTNSLKKTSRNGLSSNKSLTFRKKFIKNRSQSNTQKTKKGSLTKNYSKKKLSRPQHQRKPPATKNLSMGHKLLQKNKSRSRNRQPQYGKFKCIGRGNSLTSPLKGSLKGTRHEWKLSRPGPGPLSQANSERKKEVWHPRDKSKVSSRAATTSRYTSSDKNSAKASLMKKSEKAVKKAPARRGFARKRLQESFFKAQGKKKPKTNYNRENFLSITEVSKIGHKMGHAQHH